MSETQVIHTSAGAVYTRRRHEFQTREYLRSVSPSTRGAANPCAKLTDAKALAIFKAQDKEEVIALEFGISRQQVGKIKRKTAWAHIHLAGDTEVKL